MSSNRFFNSVLFRASIDNIRLWNVAEVGEFDKKVKSGVQFKIIAGHHGGFISQMRALILILYSALCLISSLSCRPRGSFPYNRMWEPRMARRVNTDGLCSRDKIYLLTFMVTFS